MVEMNASDTRNKSDSKVRVQNPCKDLFCGEVMWTQTPPPPVQRCGRTSLTCLGAGRNRCVCL